MFTVDYKDDGESQVSVKDGADFFASINHIRWLNNIINSGDNTFTIEGIVSDITDDPERTDGNAFACAFDMLGWYGMSWHLDDTMYMKVPNEVFAEFADPDNKNPDLFLSKKDFVNGTIACVTFHVKEVSLNKMQMHLHHLTPITGNDLKELKEVNGIQ